MRASSTKSLPYRTEPGIVSASQDRDVTPPRADALGRTPEQRQTANAFAFKWARRKTYESESVSEATRRWLVQRYCANDPSRIDAWLAGSAPKTILDAGCGAGLTA